jgi:hypothetical protein
MIDINQTLIVERILFILAILRSINSKEHKWKCKLRKLFGLFCSIKVLALIHGVINHFRKTQILLRK